MSGTFNEISVGPRKVVEKGWGYEVFVYHNLGAYLPRFCVDTVKILRFGKGKRCSKHFHVDKEELFYQVVGKLKVNLIKDAKTKTITLSEGECILIKPGMVHQMEGLEDNNLLLEISTLDKPEDSYRIQKGD